MADEEKYNIKAENYEVPNDNYRDFLVDNESPGLNDVVFNDPLTIAFWDDGTETVIKRKEGEAFDKEKSLAMAIVKKVMGNDNTYLNLFAWFIPDNED